MTASTLENCPDCGRPIPESAPQGLCPKCLLSEAAIETVPMSGPLPEDPSLDEVKAAFPSLEVLEQIGAGGMGIVYKARQRRLDRMVALKLLRCPPEQEALFAERFLREARALAKLNHPNIVTVFDFGESHGHYYLLMEFVDGVNLRQAMAGEQLTADEALRIVPVVCSALQYAHEHGVLHRDIKPANILINREGEVKMADFGLAKFVGDNDPADGLTRTESALGTPAYMAPEQTTDPSRVDHRADIYSLGVVFYEMLTGDLPLGRFPVPSSKASVDQRVDDVVMRTLEREPQERYQSAEEVRTDVEHLSCDGSSELPPSLANKPNSPKKKLLWMLWAVPLLAILLTIAFFLRLNGSEATNIEDSGRVSAHGAMIHANISSSDTPLIIAAKRGDADEIRRFIRQGADTESVNDEGYTAVLAAAKGLQYKSLEALLEGNAKISAVHAKTGNNALHLAVSAADQDNHYFPQTLRFLQDRGLSSGSTNALGQTPLMLAMEVQSEDATSRLRGVGKVLDITDNEGRMALDYATMIGQSEQTRALIRMKSPKTASWCMLQTFLYRNYPSETIIKHLQQTLEALERYPVKELQFGMGWKYTIPHPEIAVHAMMVEAAAAAGDDAMARQALADCLALWPQGSDSLPMIRRTRSDGSLTRQTLNLDREKIDQPLYHERHESALVGTTRVESDLGVAEQPLRSETFFK